MSPLEDLISKLLRCESDEPPCERNIPCPYNGRCKGDLCAKGMIRLIKELMRYEPLD